MRLSGSQRQQLQDALINAFPTPTSLEQMLSFGLNKNLREIAGEGNLHDIVFKLIQAAEAQGWVENLVRAACSTNSGNSCLKVIAEELLTNSYSEAPTVLQPNISSASSNKRKSLTDTNQPIQRISQKRIEGEQSSQSKKSQDDIKTTQLPNLPNKKLWLQLAVIPSGGVLALLILGLFFEPLRISLIRIPVISTIFDYLRYSVNSCSSYLVCVDDKVEAIFQKAFPKEDEKFLRDRVFEYRKAVNRNPKDADALTNLGEAFRLLGKPEESLKFHQKALEIDSHLEPALIGLVKTKMDLNNFTEANEENEKILQINPKNSMALKLKSELSNIAKLEERFLCATVNGVTTTIYSDLRIKKRLIQWISNTYSQEEQCQEFAGRANMILQGQGQFYATTGRMNNQPIICATNFKRSGCTALLLTVKQDKDAEAITSQLLELVSPDVNNTSPIRL